MELGEILKKNEFRFKKALGQNFITDGGLLSAIVKDAGITPADTVLEIGAGGGTLTAAIANVAKRVVAFEIDHALEPVLKETLAGRNNVEVVFDDVLKMTDAEILALAGGSFKVAANLPYYITTPLLMRFIESGLPVTSITIMVQKEVADRLTAKPGTPEYGAVTLAVRLRGEAKMVRTVGRKLFFPSPEVDSAVIRVDMTPDAYGYNDKETLLKLIRAGFAMRRKTLANNITHAFPVSKQAAGECIKNAGLSETIRGEALSLSEYIVLADDLFRIMREAGKK